MTLHQDHYWLPWNQTQWKMCYCRDLWKQQGSPTHPRKSLSLGIALPCNGHPITVGGQHTCRKQGPKLKCYSPEFLVVTSDRIKSNLQLRATQYQRFWAFPRFRMVHLESPNHICLTRCAQTYRWVGFFLCRTFLCRASLWSNPQFCGYGSKR